MDLDRHDRATVANSSKLAPPMERHGASGHTAGDVYVAQVGRAVACPAPESACGNCCWSQGSPRLGHRAGCPHVSQRHGLLWTPGLRGPHSSPVLSPLTAIAGSWGDRGSTHRPWVLGPLAPKAAEGSRASLLFSFNLFEIPLLGRVTAACPLVPGVSPRDLRCPGDVPRQPPCRGGRLYVTSFQFYQESSTPMESHVTCRHTAGDDCAAHESELSVTLL